ncbi:MAG: hypothetical protein HGA39_07825 [Coriobacteriia bacterium]|nr:hypothetical protein [Coriobacteriia bacterium]
MIVFSGPAADGAQVAQVIAVMDGSGGSVQFVNPETSATVAGTSYGSLQDAYPFAGAKGYAKQVAGEDAGWIDVPVSAWGSMVTEKGACR